MVEKHRTSQYEGVEPYTIIERLCFIKNRCPNEMVMNASVGVEVLIALTWGRVWGQKRVELLQ